MPAVTEMAHRVVAAVRAAVTSYSGCRACKQAGQRACALQGCAGTGMCDACGRHLWREVWAHLARIPRCPLCPPRRRPPAQCRAMLWGRCRSGSTPAPSTAAVGSTSAIMQQPVGTRLDQAAWRRAGSTPPGQPPAAIPSSARVATVAAPSRRQRQCPAGSSDSMLVADGSELARQAAPRPGGWGAPTAQVARAASAGTLTLWSTRSAGILRVLVLAKGTRTYSACSPSQPPCSQQVCARVWVLDTSASESAGGHVHAAVHHTAAQKMSRGRGQRQ